MNSVHLLTQEKYRVENRFENQVECTECTVLASPRAQAARSATPRPRARVCCSTLPCPARPALLPLACACSSAAPVRPSAATARLPRACALRARLRAPRPSTHALACCPAPCQRSCCAPRARPRCSCAPAVRPACCIARHFPADQAPYVTIQNLALQYNFSFQA